MTIDPFGGVIESGRLYGRGASDTKGPMAAMLAALHAVRDIIPELSHEIWFAGLAGEEAGQHGAHALAAKESFDLVIAGEPTNLDFVHTHKGSMFITLTSRGVAVHGARPQDGRNAIYPMADLLRAVRDEIAPWLATFEHPVLGHSTISAGTIKGGSKTNVVPDFCQATLDLRTVPGQDAAFKEELFERFRRACPDLEIQLYQSFPLHTSLDHPLLDKLQMLGSLPAGAPWFCDAAVFAQKGSPAIAMGPGSIAQAHTKDEWIETAELERGAAFFEAFLKSMHPQGLLPKAG
jgi:acetylornithine deacetylase/succinyl-diaminopimelate desuccinylase-like protein